MKKIIPSLICLLFALGACETVEIEKLIYDTVYIDKTRPLAPSFITVRDTVHTVDTVEVRVAIREVDTVYQVVTKDSLIIKEVEKVVYHTDTITVVDTDTVEIVKHDTVTLTVYDRTVIYQDTVYLIAGFIRPTTSIPQELIPLVLEYGEHSGNYGKGSPRSEIIIQYEDALIPGENWNSFSFDFSNQWVIYLNVNLPTEQQRAGIFRELTHLNLNKKYSNDPNKLMSPLFNPETTITTNHLNELFN